MTHIYYKRIILRFLYIFGRSGLLCAGGSLLHEEGDQLVLVRRRHGRRRQSRVVGVRFYKRVEVVLLFDEFFSV